MDALHEHTGSARRVFFGNIGAPRINAVSMWRPRPGNPLFPIPGGAARCPIRELTTESPQAPAIEPATQGAASAVSPHYSARNGSPLSSGTRTDDHAFPARFWSTPSMPCPDTRGGPWSTARIHGRSTTNPEKSPICKCLAEFPAIKVMHGVLRRLQKSPTVQPLARKIALRPPGSPPEPNSSLVGTPGRVGLPAPPPARPP